MARCALALALLTLAACQTAPSRDGHPLDPLTVREMETAVRVLQEAGKGSGSVVYPSIALQEPPKDAVLSGRKLPRQAFAVTFDRRANRTAEAVIDLGARKLVSWREVPEVQPAVGGDDAVLVERILQFDARWQQAMKDRGISPRDAVVVAWTAGFFGRREDDGSRLVQALTFARSRRADIYARPVEGVLALVDLTHERVVAWQDSGVIPRPPDPSPVRLREPVKPLRITQPEGVSFAVDGQEVRWQRWRFRWAVHPREGLVLYTIGYEDQGRVRPVLYRASVSEMVVPYGDPSPAWFFRSSFDVGELGIGKTVSPMRRGIDCPQNSVLFPAVLAGDDGRPQTVENAVAIYERDAGLAWKHGEDARRARELVIGFLTEVGNYDYGFDWVFRQDGSIGVKVSMTGMMAAKGVAGQAHDHFGHIVEPNLSAVHHQHFFSFRLDFDVDGRENSIVEMDTASRPPGPGNPYGTGFGISETPLRSEAEARRPVDVGASRRWKVVNPGRVNSLGQPSGYILLPGENAFPYTSPGSWIRKRAGFLDAHLWATQYAEGELYAAGDYPNQSRGGDGLPKWSARNRDLTNRDLVVWYTLGVTHLPRPEEWPVMPVHLMGFRLLPAGFFTRNPALDLP